MGEYDSTTNVGTDELRLFNDHQKNNFKPFIEYMNEYYVEQYNIKTFITYYSNWPFTTSIHKYFY